MSRSREEADAERLVKSLKEILKERKIAYQAIADALGLSLATMKRMLNKPSLPLDRLFAICHMAQIDPAEVFARSARNEPSHSIFTIPQDELFDLHPACLSYFMELALSDKSPDDLAQEHDLTSLSTETYLTLLAKVGLIERQTGTQVRLLLTPPFGFGPDSRVLKKEHAAFIQETVDAVLNPKLGKNCESFAILKPLCLPSAQCKELIKDLTQMIDRYAYLSEHVYFKDGTSPMWNASITLAPAESSGSSGHPISNWPASA